MIIELLTQKGFVQDVDYSFTNGELVPLEQTRTVIQEIDHPAVEEQTEEQEALDPQGQSFDPPQFETVVTVVAQEAYTEQVEVQETFIAELPSLESLKLEAVKLSDPALLIGEVLKGKDINDDDSLNIDLFLKGQGGWRFKNIPAPSINDLYDLIAPVKLKQDKKKTTEIKIKSGREAREVCNKVLDLIAGYNLDRELTAEEITQMQSTFGTIEQVLRAGRPAVARTLIDQMTVDGVLVTQEMKDDALEILNAHLPPIVTAPQA